MERRTLSAAPLREFTVGQNIDLVLKAPASHKQPNSEAILAVADLPGKRMD
jgi:hypothetical protein